MPELQTFHGHVVDLRRHVNVHLRHLRPFAPTERYELWLRAPDGAERKFTLHTREMPARRGHELSLVTTAQRRPRVLGVANWTTIDGVNYARSEPSTLVQRLDGVWLVVSFHRHDGKVWRCRDGAVRTGRRTGGGHRCSGALGGAATAGLAGGSSPGFGGVAD